ncbi:hypothetical protein V1508DRAFT_425642 [Lipomyces doorenjongii]|uniref:uncharacterized protein n=1 Tax=Lipomyces doorenjongii TaxID=383834 RepID=UPI0034CD3960
MPYANENGTQLALNAYKTRQIKFITPAAKNFNVPLTALRDRINGTTARQDKRANSHVLTETKEQTLVTRISDADKQGLPSQIKKKARKRASLALIKF